MSDWWEFTAAVAVALLIGKILFLGG